MGDDFNISDILDSLKKMFLPGPGKSVSTPIPAQNQAIEQTKKPQELGVFQSPIKGNWKNSGNFSPGVATDARHLTGHNGIDMRAPGGTAIYPMSQGIIINVGTDPKGGNVINIDHGNGIKTFYAHLGTVKVHKGDKVSNDTVIGTIGDTGNAKGTWPHIHFEVRVGGQLQNPSNGFFSVPKYEDANVKVEKKWLPGAQEAATAWSMKSHIQQRRVAFSKTVDDIYKASFKFYKLASKG